jgi:hypothetical protein
MPDAVNMPEKLWDLANLITGFAILQTLATTFALAKGELEILKRAAAHRWAVIGTIVLTVCYVIAICWCGYEGCKLDSASNSNLWIIVTSGRVVAVLLFITMVMAALYGSRHPAKWGQHSN